MTHLHHSLRKIYAFQILRCSRFRSRSSAPIECLGRCDTDAMSDHPTATTSVRAAVLRAGDAPYSIEDVELRAVRSNEVLVRIVGAGMCHTDVLPRMPGFLAPPPIIAGHEGSGVVEAVGADVTGVAVGDHVVLSFDSCGVCAQLPPPGSPPTATRSCCATCSAASSTAPPPSPMPTARRSAARWFGQSSFASHAIATERNAVVVDTSLPLELLGPLGCGIQTGAGVDPGARWTCSRAPASSVFGAGAVGLAAVMAAKVAGATTIIAVDLQQHRLRPGARARRHARARRGAPTSRPRSRRSPVAACSTRSTRRACRP